jgi:hypothetical protein
MHGTFQNSGRKDLERFHHKETIHVWGYRYIWSDLKTRKCIKMLHGTPLVNTIFYFYNLLTIILRGNGEKEGWWEVNKIKLYYTRVGMS